jgi:hypothetical protein
VGIVSTITEADTSMKSKVMPRIRGVRGVRGIRIMRFKHNMHSVVRYR